jgi:ABC-2 type transport system ATP-binding protein
MQAHGSREPTVHADVSRLMALPDSPAPLLEILGIEVRYDAFHLGPVNMTMAGAQVACLLGPNGSGKTSLIRSVLGLQRSQSGHAALDGGTLAGRPPRALAHVGYVSDSPDDMISELTPEEYWGFCAIAYTRYGGDVDTMLARARQLATLLDFVPPRRSIAGCSLGMRRKTQLIAGMLHRPDVLVLDEPLIGLDFISIRALETLLVAERGRGCLVWMASHDLGLAARLADRVTVLHLGRFILDHVVSTTPSDQSVEERVEAAIRNARTAVT